MIACFIYKELNLFVSDLAIVFFDADNLLKYPLKLKIGKVATDEYLKR